MNILIYNFLLLLLSVYTVGFFIWMNRIESCLEEEGNDGNIILKLKVFAWFFYFKELKSYIEQYDIKLNSRRKNK